MLDSSFQGVKRLFVLAYDNTASDNQVSVDFLKKYFLPRVKVENYNSDIDGRNFYDQPINDSIKQYSAMKQWSQKSIYRPGWWSDDWLLVGFCLFSKKYRLIAADLSKQNVLHADSRAIQQIILIGKIKSTVVNKQKKQYYNFLKEQQKFCK